MPRIFAIDWAHNEEKLSVWDGRKITHSLPKKAEGLVIVTENMPNKYAKPYIEAGGKVLRCSPNASASYREKYSFPKTDDNDAIIIWQLYHDNPNIFREMKEDTKLKQLYVNYSQLTKQIAAAKNRQWASEDPANEAYIDDLEAVKTRQLKRIEKELKAYPVWTTFASKIKGVGPALAAGLIAVIGDIKRFENISNLNAYFGLQVQDGKCVRREKGKVANWNSDGRALICELIPSQFVRQKTPVYGAIYREDALRWKMIYEEDADKPKEQRRCQSLGHAERRARRKAGKIFLHHFWKVWREAEGLPTPQPYAIAMGGHSKEILPPTAYPGLT